MSEHKNSDAILTLKQRQSLASFESFLNKVGFKRIDGAIYGLLVLSQQPLSQEQIEAELSLSQSAISQSLKTLTHYGAIEINDSREHNSKRVKLYHAKVDSLSIVASIFRKREQEAVLEFKYMAQELLNENQASDLLVSKRLQSIIATCEVAESVMEFVMKLANHHVGTEYTKVLKKLPGALDLLLKTTGPLGEIAGGLKNNLTSKLLKGLDQGLAKYSDMNAQTKEGPQ